MPDDIHEQVLRQMRDKGITQYRLAKLTGIPQPNLSRFLSGGAGMSVDTLRKIAKALEMAIIIEPEE